MSMISESKAWRDLSAHARSLRDASLSALFAADPLRRERLTVRAQDAGISADFSRNRLDGATVGLLAELAREARLERWRTAMFDGEKINDTEGRAVLHVALRAPGGATFSVDGKDVMADVRETRRRMEEISVRVRSGRWTGAAGKPVRNVVNIGIGGSDLGPRLVASALKDFAGQDAPCVRFVANVDDAALSDALEGLSPDETLFVVVSKTFTTQETLMNAKAARKWITDSLGESAVARHFLAVSVNLKATAEFGIAPANILPMWDWVGGRYSLWSAVGLAAAIAMGWENFAEMLAGAAAMDAHFLSAPFEKNLPTMLALTGIWHRNFWDARSHAVLPYAERLRELPRFLQQLIMESNGKSVTRDGKAVDYGTSPVIFGECGTVGQHSFHQMLHQGTDIIPCDFIGVKNRSGGAPEHHSALLANMEAQAEALMRGSREAEAFRANPGNRPSTTIWLDALCPRTLGALLAMYEHMTFAQGIVWNINSFDQWGVELGKKLAKESGRAS